MNLIDKTIRYFNPKAAFKREVARRGINILNSGYSHHGASHIKKGLVGWDYSGGSPIEDIDENLQTLRERSRDLYMGVPLATGALKTIRTNVVGTGIRLKPQVDAKFLGLSDDEAKNLEESIEREFSLWADTPNCDYQRLNNFYELQQLVFLSHLMCGDAIALLPYKKRAGSAYELTVHLIEADRLCTPYSKRGDVNISEGVEVKDGEVVAYHIANFHPLSYKFYQGKREWQRIEAYGAKTGRRNVIHIMESERIGQRRGVPLLSPVIESFKQLGRYSEAELMAAVVTAMYTVFIESENSNQGEFGLGNSIPEPMQMDSEDENSYEMGYGSMVELEPGEKIKEANPSRPNTAFDGFVSSMCKQIGAALEIPNDLLLKQFNASYSASRAALLEAWKMFKMRRSWLANDFCQPIYEEWFSEAVANGRIYAPGFFDDPIIKKAYCTAEWSGPSQGQLDPVKEVNAAITRVKNGFSTRTKESIELTGTDYDKNISKLTKEEALLKEVYPEGGN